MSEQGKYIIIESSELKLYSNTTECKTIEGSLTDFLSTHQEYIQIRRNCAVNQSEIVQINFEQKKVILSGNLELSMTGRFLLRLRLKNRQEL